MHCELEILLEKLGVVAFLHMKVNSKVCLSVLKELYDLRMVHHRVNHALVTSLLLHSGLDKHLLEDYFLNHSLLVPILDKVHCRACQREVVNDLHHFVILEFLNREGCKFGVLVPNLVLWV